MLAVLLVVMSFVLCVASFNTRVKWSVPSIIHAVDMKAQKPEDLAALKQIDEQAIKRKLKAQDGTVLDGAFLPHENPRALVYVCHGFGDRCFESVQVPVRMFQELGCSVFLPHSRGFGSQDGNWSTMGVRDRADHIAWLELLLKENPNLPVCLYGVSMGAASVMNLCDAPLSGRIAGIIEDCGYVDLNEQLRHSLRFLIGIDPIPFFYTGRLAARLVPGFSFSDFDLREKLAVNQIPMLAIHGTQDAFVPCSNLDLIEKICPKERLRVLRVDGAAHCMSFRRDPDFYCRSIAAFLEQTLPGADETEMKEPENSAAIPQKF